MLVSDALNVLIQIFFIGLGILTCLHYIRHREVLWRDVALLFTILSIPFVFQLISAITGEPISEGGSILSILGLLLQPYLVIRILKNLQPTSSKIVRYTFISMVFTFLAGFFVGSKLPLVTTLISQGYLIGFNLYAFLGFWRGSIPEQGITRYRLRFAAAGALLFATTLGGALIGNFIPAIQGIILVAAQLMAVLSALFFFIGFVPPRWLVLMWQMRELHHYLFTVIHAASTISPENKDNNNNEEHAPLFDTTSRIQQLCQSSLRLVGGFACGVIRQNTNTERLLSDTIEDQWFVYQSTHPDVFSAIPQSVFENLFADPIAGCLPIQSDDANPSNNNPASRWVIMPIIVDQNLWGLLLVMINRPPLFIEDDLRMLNFMVHENSVILINDQLITELKDYSRQLEISNQELESFSYSVSHDLRAPLRSLNGFSHALQEDYADKLDEDGQNYLTRIRTSSDRMGQLIDDLLKLSHITRSEIRREKIDMSLIARIVFSELQAEQPERVVNVKVDPQLQIYGDSHLIRIALVNLLNNAWKYTGKQSHPNIEFGVTKTPDGQKVYFVRDNGAGFDMAYVDKLFGVFQRLHNTSDFQGNGIGLATVKRIIKRHGGDVWAEAKVDQGATFYFTVN